MGAKISSPRRKATTSQICSEILKVYSAIKFLLKAANTPWLAGLFFLSTVWDVSVTRDILRRLTDSETATLALIGAQLLAVGWCYVHIARRLPQTPRRCRHDGGAMRARPSQMCKYFSQI